MFPFFLCSEVLRGFMFRDILKFLFFIIPRVILNGLEGIIFGGITINGYDLIFSKRQTKKQIEEKVLLDYLKKCHKKAVKEDNKNNGKTQGNG